MNVSWFPEQIAPKTSIIRYNMNEELLSNQLAKELDEELEEEQTVHFAQKKVWRQLWMDNSFHCANWEWVISPEQKNQSTL